MAAMLGKSPIQKYDGTQISNPEREQRAYGDENRISPLY
jgi:hypothetical protein